MNKIQEQQYQQASAACGAMKDLEQQKACQMNLASQQTGVTSNAEDAMSNNSSLQSRATLINAASTIVSVINMLSSSGKESTCTSKTILAYTGIGGTITDILMKIKTKKATDDLINKYQITKADTPYAAQTKALEYLRDEQQTVRDIAEQEKNRQTLLMIGYGAAFATAAYEQFTGSTCADKKAPDKPAAEAPKPTEDQSQAETNRLNNHTPVKSDEIPKLEAPEEVKVDYSLNKDGSAKLPTISGDVVEEGVPTTITPPSIDTTSSDTCKIPGTCKFQAGEEGPVPQSGPNFSDVKTQYCKTNNYQYQYVTNLDNGKDYVVYTDPKTNVTSYYEAKPSSLIDKSTGGPILKASGPPLGSMDTSGQYFNVSNNSSRGTINTGTQFNAAPSVWRPPTTNRPK